MNRIVRGFGVEAGCAPARLAVGWRWSTGCSLLALGGALLASCGQVRDGAAVGGETHFLVTCGEGCGAGLTCIDGACTRSCEPGFSSCSELATEASCVSAPGDESERAAFGGSCDVLCTDDGDCAPLGRGFSCRSGACRAEPESRQLELSSSLSLGPPLVRATEADTCKSGLRWVGGDHGSAEMRPGSDCVGCHREARARPLILGGTVYPIGNPWEEHPLDDCFGLEGIEVTVVDAEGRERTTVTNRAGNFFFEGRESEITMPYEASMRWGLDRAEMVPVMFTKPSYGGCARCHGLPLGEASAPIPFLPEPEDPEYVNPAGAIFPPGLYR